MSENVLGLLRDMRSARKQSPVAMAQRQRARLSEMVAFARAYSPYYRELYHDLPERVEDSTLLPVTSKKALMEHFDDWVTDCEVTYEKVRAFVDNPTSLGNGFSTSTWWPPRQAPAAPGASSSSTIAPSTWPPPPATA